MRRAARPTALVAVLALVGAAPAPAEQCLTPAQAEALVVTVLPDALEAIGRACSVTLPPGASLRAGLPPLLARYRADAATVGPDADAAVSRLVGLDVKGMDPAAIRPMMTGALAAEMTKSIKPRDCARVDEAVRLLGPLPARNLAGLVRLLLQSDTRGKAPFTICRAPGQ